MERCAIAEGFLTISGGFTVTRSQPSRSELSNIQSAEAYIPAEAICGHPVQRSATFAALKLAKG
jgi:hypothetical protein